MKKVARAGQWVEIEMLVCQAETRSKELPKDTQVIYYTARIKGYLINEARLGQEATIRSILGRELKGKLLAFNPPFPATFGAPVPELMDVGKELKSLMKKIEEK